MFKKTLIFMLVLCAPLALYSATTGKIVGKVVDRETGDALPGANIIVVGTSLGAATDVSGQYLMLNIPVGTYTLRASFIGYQNVLLTNVRVHQDLTLQVDFELPSEAIEVSEITIVSERPLVNKNVTNSTKITTSEEISVLPLRGFRNVVSVNAGVTQVGGRTYVRGGRREEIATYIDGVYQNLPLSGRASGDIATGAIEEVNFQAGGFNAEYGFANSGIINLTSKSGSNQFNFTGELITDAWLSKDSKKLGTYSYGQNYYSATLSGPVPGFGQKLKFYVGVELQDLADRAPSGFAYNRLILDADGNPLDADGSRITFFTGDADSNSASVKRGYNLDDAFPEFDTDGVIREYQFDERGVWDNRDVENKLWNVNLTYEVSQALKFKVGGNSRRSDGRDIAGYSPGTDLRNNLIGSSHNLQLWGNADNPRIQSWQDSYFAKITHTLGSRTFYTFQANYFRDDNLQSSPDFGRSFWNIGDKDDQIKFDGPGQDGITNPAVEQVGSKPNLEPRSADLFSSLGTQPGRYVDRRWTFWGVKGDITHQVGLHHEIKAGVEWRQNDYRLYDIGGYGAADIHRLAGQLVNAGPGNSAQRAYQSRNLDNFGFDLFGNKTDDASLLSDGRNAAKKPVIAAFYLQDKIELQDLVINLGLRWDYFSADNDQIDDLENVTLVQNQDLGGIWDVDPSNFVGNNAKSTLSPRLGLSFPVSDRTVFHAQYGKFVQTPELVRLYVSTTLYGGNLNSGNFFRQPNPNLDLMRTTAYEFGFRNQIGSNSALDLTAYYKEIRNYVALRQLFDARPVPYSVYTSQDYGTVKGFSLTYNLRPTNRLSASANYTLQYAAGTGSDANSNQIIAWQGNPDSFPTFASPLDFDQRHTGTVNFDYRTRQGDFLGEWGLNMLLSFGSGLSYTPTRIESEVNPSSNSTVPLGQFGSATGPWTYQMDLKLDKSFNVASTRFVVYLWVINLTNALNANWVYGGTGSVESDGYLSTPQGLGNFVNNQGTNGEALYNHLVKSPYNVGPPRQMRLGLRFEL